MVEIPLLLVNNKSPHTSKIPFTDASFVTLSFSIDVLVYVVEPVILVVPSTIKFPFIDTSPLLLGSITRFGVLLIVDIPFLLLRIRSPHKSNTPFIEASLITSILLLKETSHRIFK